MDTGTGCFFTLRGDIGRQLTLRPTQYRVSRLSATGRVNYRAQLADALKIVRNLVDCCPYRAGSQTSRSKRLQVLHQLFRDRQALRVEPLNLIDAGAGVLGRRTIGTGLPNQNLEAARNGPYARPAVLPALAVP
jgi:hypothetical protein